MKNSNIEHLTPKEIVSYLDKYVIDQDDAKRTIAIALRNRYRRMQLPEDLQKDIMPKNILMIGSTGVGKTEIARRLAQMMQLPFIKVEASKYTEVGFVGRDVESMIRDLANIGLQLTRESENEKNRDKIEQYVEDKILEKLLPHLPDGANEQKKEEYIHTLEKMRQKFRSGELDDLKISIEMPPSSSMAGMDDMLPPQMISVQESIVKVLGGV
ncbi:MAG: AAA family ATPase, partial [Campylobacterales bacterium]|nr:AAA family ATPase [Campylobacterales bacterium]